MTGASSGLGAATARRLAKAGASVALLALVALVPLLGAAQAQTPKDLIAALLVKWNEPTPPFKMIGNVYYVGTDDVVWFPPGLKHWHGISPMTAMTHIAIQESLNGKNVDWMEKVSDEQYRRS